MKDNTNELIKGNWSEIGEDVFQMTIDNIIDNPICELPWLKIITNCVGSIRDRILLKKLYMFMYYGKDIGLEERCNFCRRILMKMEQ